MPDITLFECITAMMIYGTKKGQSGMALYDPLKGQHDPLQSPCVRNCCLDEQDICMGCGRTLTEIRAWSSLTEAQRREILAKASARQQQRMEHRKGL